jgi:hypothetical protein
MRMIFSVAALLVVAFVLLNLGKKQAEALRPAAAGKAASGPPDATNLPQKYQQDVQKALQQGMQQRASEPSQ